jgi:hypothetical protein
MDDNDNALNFSRGAQLVASTVTTEDIYETPERSECGENSTDVSALKLL